MVAFAPLRRFFMLGMRKIVVQHWLKTLYFFLLSTFKRASRLAISQVV